MNEYISNKAVVKIQGSVDHDKLKKATEAFLKKAEQQRKVKK